MRDIAGCADLIMPNLTEAALLLGIEYKNVYSRDEIKEMLYGLTKLGAGLTVITGVSFEEGMIGAAAYNSKDGGYDEFFTKRQVKSYHGTGDIFASIVTADWLNGKDMGFCIKDACTFIEKCIKKTLPVKNHEYGVLFEEVLADERRNTCIQGKQSIT